MTKVKVLSMTHPRDLELKIEKYLREGFKLAGSVTTTVRLSGDTIYVATLVQEEE